MKKNIVSMAGLAVLSVFLIGCGGFFNPEASKLSPPEWIIGTWSDSLGMSTYIFENDNVSYVVADSSATISYKEYFRYMNVTEEKTTSLYSFSASLPLIGTDIGTWRFVSTSATTIDHSIIVSGDTTDVFNLIKE